MNEQIKKLAEEAGLDAKEIRDDESLTLYAFENFDIEKFAELVRDDERDKCASDYLQDCCDAIAVAEHNEREACAKIADDMAEDVVRFEFNQIIALDRCAEAIRAGGEK